MRHISISRYDTGNGSSTRAAPIASITGETDMFYTFAQNNSFGTFDINANVRAYVIVEADTPDEANRKAMNIGIYFNGVSENIDCPCCGDRWFPVGEANESKVPTIRWTELDLTHFSSTQMNDCDIVIHFTNGNRLYGQVKA